ncbi:MAG: pyridoxal-phosphate dependent enzyme [Calditrichaeota bacterium]|nr:pyridoxal-phosphate dependent enzyme [Calditrichota bacterium]
MLDIPTFEDIQKAAERIQPHAHRTPVLTCTTLNHRFGAQLFFKCENFQRVGAFKFRGACNAVFSLSEEEAQRGVATHSSGNHAAALALAARMRGIRAHIVMPENSAKIKIAAVKDYGATITFCRPTLEARGTTLEEVVKKTGATFIHPYDNVRVIAGQGTAALELLQELPDLDMIMAPVSGGGLMSGTCIAAKALSPRIEPIGVEPENADDAYRSLQAGKLTPQASTHTIADGLRAMLSERTFTILRTHDCRIATVSESAIIEAMRLVWERMKIIIEPSAAVTVAALLENKVAITDKRVGIILSGGNVDLDELPWR